MDASGAPLNLSARLGIQTVKVNNVNTPLELAKVMDTDMGLSVRANVFFNSTIATGSPGGWVPGVASAKETVKEAVFKRR